MLWYTILLIAGIVIAIGNGEYENLDFKDSSHNDRRKRNTFDLLINKTHGTHLDVSKNNLGSYLDKIIKENFGVKTLDVYSFHMTTTQKISNLPVDRHLSFFTVAVTGISDPKSVTLLRPDGQLEAFNGTSTLDDIGHSTVILSVKEVIPGNWTLRKSESSVWIVQLKGSGNVTFSYKFMENIRGSLYDVDEARPLAGSEVTILGKLKSTPALLTEHIFLIRRVDGGVLQTLPVINPSVLQVKLNIPSDKFYISFACKENGNLIMRSNTTTVDPITGKLGKIISNEMITPGIKDTVQFSVINLASVQQQFVVEVSDTKNCLLGPKTLNPHLLGNETKLYKVDILGKLHQTSTSVEIVLKQESKIIQTLSKQINIAEVLAPDITVMGKSDCNIMFMNTYNCSKGLWKSELYIVYHSLKKTLRPVNPNVKKLVIIDTFGNNTVFNVSISGTCCHYKTDIIVEDIAGNIIPYHEDFSGGLPFTTLMKNTTFKGSTTGTHNTAGIVAGAVVGSIVVIGTITVLVPFVWKKIHLKTVTRDI